MAKIVEVTNPVTGQPVQVDQLDHTAQEIDDGIARALPGGYYDKWVSQLVNPNLLDNWYFGNPVNQRGKTEYSGNQSYIIDRWSMRGSASTTIDLEADGLVINCGSSFNAIVQAFENPSLLLGKTVTLSALVTENTNVGESIIEVGNATAAFAAGSVLGETQFTGAGLFSVTVEIPSSLTNTYLTSIICAGNPPTNGARFKIAAAKLELGSQQTLAHQDADGNWVLNEIPDYGEQLRRCQRYFQLYSSANLRPAKAVDCRPTMRADPSQSTIVVNSTTYYYNTADL